MFEFDLTNIINKFDHIYFCLIRSNAPLEFEFDN